jgi:hypothetical protein
MSVHDLEIEMIALEKRLAHFEDLLELSIKNNDTLTRTRAILHEVKKLSEKLNELKRVSLIKKSES